MDFVVKQNTKDEMVKYVCELYDEYKEILKDDPQLLREILFKKYTYDFVVDGDLHKSGVIISPSDINSYFTIKKLNEEKKDLTVICFDMHSDTYDYNDFLWKGNSFSKLMKEGYINHYIVIGVPKHKKQNSIEDTNEDLRNRVHLIEKEELWNILHSIGCQNIFISIDADCFNCRKSKYTAIEYSPSTILNFVSYIDEINKENYIEKIHECVHVKNELGYSNYYHTGENDLSYQDVVSIINCLSTYCEINNINIGLKHGEPYYQIMEISGYDYGNLTSEMVVELIERLSIKEVKKDV